MRTLRDRPIRQKLLVILIVVTGIATLLSGTALIISDSLLFRAALLRDVAALAKIIGDNSTAALSFEDPNVAKEVLGSLQARPHIVSACIYSPDGTLFAKYLRPDAGACNPPLTAETVNFTNAGLSTSHAIVLNNQRIGTLVMLYDTDEIRERMVLYAGIVLGILLVSGVIAFLLSSRLRDAITEPVTHLVEAAASVSKTGDYSVRVTKDSEDEIGVLVDSFNEMLGGVQSREQEIQSARNFLQTTLTSIGDAVIATDTGGRIIFANTVARTLVRWPAGADMTGKPIHEVFRIVNEFTRMPVENPVEKILRERGIAGLANHTILVAQDGTEVPIDDSAAPIEQGGQILGVVLVFRDITERRRAQQDAAYLAAIVESSDDSIIGTTPEGVIQTWNAGAERLYQYTAAEVVGRSMLDLIPAERRHEETQILEGLKSGTTVMRLETVRTRKDGTQVDISLTVSPIRGRSGQLLGLSRIARDMTEQKRNAEQMRQTQKLESLGVLAGGIAHDFNNLLTGILGNASLAVEEIASGSSPESSLGAVIDAAERAAQLAQQMLAYSGKGRFVVEDIDLSTRIRQTLPLIRSAIPPLVELQLDLARDLPPIEADTAQVQQLIMNIIINAAEAIPDGSRGTVAVGTRAQTIDGRYAPVDGTGELCTGPHVLFEVRDTGSGMDEKTKARIFDPFFTTKFTGRGLGLAAVMGIVRGHKGCIEVLSAPGRGTTFRVLLPAAEVHERSAPPLQEDVAPGFHTGSGAVLVVDDEPIVLKVARNALERAGYTVLVAEDGAVGFDAFRREADRLRCVVLDLTMPVVGGEEALEKMKAVRSDIPVILSSGFDEAQAVRRFEGKGLAGFLQKPYKSAALVEIVGRVLTQRTTQ